MRKENSLLRWKKLLSSDEFLAAAADQLELVNPDDVRGNIYLPTEVEVEGSGRTAAVTWESSNPAVVTDQEQDGKPAGVVTRQAEDTTVTLTAAITAEEGAGRKRIYSDSKESP